MKTQTVEVVGQRLHQRMAVAEAGIGAAVYGISTYVASLYAD
jgi:hypothetical protein